MAFTHAGISHLPLHPSSSWRKYQSIHDNTWLIYNAVLKWKDVKYCSLTALSVESTSANKSIFFKTCWRTFDSHIYRIEFCDERCKEKQLMGMCATVRQYDPDTNENTVIIPLLCSSLQKPATAGEVKYRWQKIKLNQTCKGVDWQHTHIQSLMTTTHNVMQVAEFHCYHINICLLYTGQVIC